MAELSGIRQEPENDIPDEAKLFYRVHKSLAPGNQLGPNIFREQKGAMSSDWEKHSTPEATRDRATVPADNGILTLIAGGIPSIPGLTLKYEPETDNLAHTNTYGVSGANKTKARHELFRRFNQWEIEPDHNLGLIRERTPDRPST